ncbi:MAG: OmpH family outer membrane protein [Pyrinomonadaceae bacterium]
MKRLNLIAASFIFAATAFAASAFAQASGAPQTTPAGAGKIGIVNTSMFLEDKPGAGITKFKNAIAALDAEFKPVNDELNKMLQDYQNKVDAFNKKKNATGVPVNQEALAADATVIADLEKDIKRKQEDAKARYDRRQDAVIGPIYGDIVKAMNEFAKAKGYAVILDGLRLQEAQILLGFDDKYDVTKEFIAYYNARPAGAATAAVPATTPRQ